MNTMYWLVQGAYKKGNRDQTRELEIERSVETVKIAAASVSKGTTKF